MIGMSVNTFCARAASSKARQLRTEAGRSRAWSMRPSRVERDPGERLAARRLGPSQAGSAARHDGLAAGTGFAEVGLDQAAGLLHLGHHHPHPGEYVAGRLRGDIGRGLIAYSGRMVTPNVDRLARRARDRTHE